MRPIVKWAFEAAGIVLALSAAIAAKINDQPWALGLLGAAIVPLWFAAIRQRLQVDKVLTDVQQAKEELQRAIFGQAIPDAETMRDQIMRNGLFHTDPNGQVAVDDVFWVLFCEYLRDRQEHPDPLRAAESALKALNARRFDIHPRQVYSLMRALASRRYPYFGIATDADINVALGRHPSGSGTAPTTEEIEDARYFLFKMPLEPDYRGKIRRLFWLQNPGLLNQLSKELKVLLKRQVDEMGNDFGLREGSAPSNCGFYSVVAKGELDTQSGHNTIRFGDFRNQRRELEDRLNDESRGRLASRVAKW